MMYVLLAGKGCGLKKLGHRNTKRSNYRIQGYAGQAHANLLGAFLERDTKQQQVLVFYDMEMSDPVFFCAFVQLTNEIKYPQ